MSIHVSCLCGKSFVLADDLGGKKAQCPACERTFTIPFMSSPESPTQGRARARSTRPAVPGAKRKSKSVSPNRAGTQRAGSGAGGILLRIALVVVAIGVAGIAYSRYTDHASKKSTETPASVVHVDVEPTAPPKQVSTMVATSVVPPTRPLVSTVSAVSAGDASDRVTQRLRTLGIKNHNGDFHPHPLPSSRKGWEVANLGPIGIGLHLVSPGFNLKISNIEKGSPAEKSGKLKKGQIIKSINGISFPATIKDPRIIFGDIITEAEAGDGKVLFALNDGQKVTVQIPIMGRYSKTWPLNCEKSNKVVRGLADIISKDEKPKWGSVLFLLSTGEEKDLAVVKNWMKDLKTIGAYNWHKGYEGPGLCEYYLRTGDSSVLPIIEKMVKELQGYEYIGSWAGKTHGNFKYGQMNAAGVNCLTFLLLSKMCGVDVDEAMLQRTLTRYYRYIGHASVPYGNSLPEGGYRENGKTGALAVAMSAAARLAPEGESSIYAQARDTAAMKGFYGTNWFHSAHTGGGIGEIWHHASIGLMREKRPVQYRSYLDTRRWVMDLSRRFNGSIGIAGIKDRYDVSSTEGAYTWGTFFALTYTIPRKHLQLYGAPKTKWCQTAKLPVRPWGNPADDIFVSPAPLEEPGSITVDELLEEIVQHDSSIPIHARLKEGGQTVYKKYLGHPEFVLRSATMRAASAAGDAAHLVIPLLKSTDPRQRYSGILAINGMYKGGALPEEQLTPEMFDLIGSMIEDKEESWWLLQGAVQALRRGGAARVLAHKERLFELLDHEEWWLQMPALGTLSLVAFDDNSYKEVLPRIVKTYTGITTGVAQYSGNGYLMRGLKAASPAVRAYGYTLLEKSYLDLPEKIVYPNGYLLSRGGAITRSRYFSLLNIFPEGKSFAMKQPRITTKYAQSGDEKDKYRYSGTFTPNKAVVGKWHNHFYVFRGKMETMEDLKKEARNMEGRYRGKKMSFSKIHHPLVLLDNGVVKQGYSQHFWSEDMLIGYNDGIARKMETITLSGFDFLILEIGGFTEAETSKTWIERHRIYLRVE